MPRDGKGRLVLRLLKTGFKTYETPLAPPIDSRGTPGSTVDFLLGALFFVGWINLLML